MSASKPQPAGHPEPLGPGLDGEPSGAPAGLSLPLLEAIRRREAEAKRRVAAERETLAAQLAEAEGRAREMIAEAESAGRREGEAQHRASQEAAEREAAEVVERARAQAEALHSISPRLLETLAVQALRIVIGEDHEA